MLVSFLCNSIVVGLAVLLHYEALNRIGWLITHIRLFTQIRIMFGVFLALTAHTVEVAIFAVAYYLMHHRDGFGDLTGNFDGSFLDSLYFSFTVFKTIIFNKDNCFVVIFYILIYFQTIAVYLQKLFFFSFLCVFL